MHVIHISQSKTLPIRSEVLRPGKSVEDCYFPNDFDLKTSHFGVIFENDIVGIASLYQSTHPTLSAKNSWQIRGMATRPNYFNTGVGKLLVQYSINHAVLNKGDIVWCNARESAVGFYQKQGFSIEGNKFLINEIGWHYLMSIKLY